MSKILVVMPCYNAASTVVEAIFSVFNQTYKSFQLVCCDDASTDNTLEVLKSLNVSLLSNPHNIGTGNTVNRVIQENQDFEFITWVSADNVLKDTFLEKHIEKLLGGYAISYSNWALLGDGRPYAPKQDLLHLKETLYLGPSFMFRKALFDVAGPFHSLAGEDHYFAVQCSIANAKFGYIPEYLVEYRKHDNSVSGRIRNGEDIKTCNLEALKKAALITKSNGTNSYDQSKKSS